jgi:mannan endo-1,4-beta-mannosidase
MKKLLNIILITVLIGSEGFSQDNFIHTRDQNFYEGDTEFYFLGFSAYYLQWAASDSSKKYIVDDVFRIADETGVKVIRTWAFNSGPDYTGSSVIRFSPYGLKENGLRALDYVIYKAKQYDINLILTLENNFSDFGGIEQYVKWANQFLSPETGKVYNHNDFFTDDSIKNWYKFYVGSILNRTNIYTDVEYKNETVIMSYELINEASNTGHPVSIINDWYREMSACFKSIDNNHMLTTGEIGYDSHKENYSDADLFYNSSYFLFNGYKGTSFTDNTALENIDYSSYHLYPDPWGFEPLAGNTWINDHVNISGKFNKPALLGEFGVINRKLENYKVYFQTIRNTPSRSAVIWQYVHPDLMNIADAYAFNEIQNPDLFTLFKEHINLLYKDTVTSADKDFVLYQNYPNPFNPTTTIRYSLRQTGYVRVELFNSLGKLVKVIDKGVRAAGTHSLFLSFDNGLFASGVYFYRLTAGPGNFSDTRKMILLK